MSDQFGNTPNFGVPTMTMSGPPISDEVKRLLAGAIGCPPEAIVGIASRRGEVAVQLTYGGTHQQISLKVGYPVPVTGVAEAGIWREVARWEVGGRPEDRVREVLIFSEDGQVAEAEVASLDFPCTTSEETAQRLSWTHPLGVNRELKE